MVGFSVRSVVEPGAMQPVHEGWTGGDDLDQRHDEILPEICGQLSMGARAVRRAHETNQKKPELLMA